MFARVSTLLPLVLLASASYLAVRDTTANQCNTGDSFCCNNPASSFNQTYTNTSGLSLANMVETAAANANFTCSAVAVNNCVQQPFCCTSVQKGNSTTVECSAISS